jgi:hypothetical protein
MLFFQTSHPTSDLGKGQTTRRVAATDCLKLTVLQPPPQVIILHGDYFSVTP